MKKQKRSAFNQTQANKKITEVQSSKSLPRTLMIICALFAFALYANTLVNEFTVDDDMVIMKNDFTTQGISALPKIFSTAYRAGYTDRNEGLYRPLSVAMFAAEWELAGKNPFLYHLLNVLLYVITAVVLFLTLKLMLEGKNLLLPFLIALLFIAHPVHTEVIANVKSGDEVLAFLFSMLTIYFSLKFVGTERKKFMLMSMLCFFLALLSKESAVTIVALVPLTLYFFKTPVKKQWSSIAIGLVLPLIIYFIIRYSVLKGITNFSEILLINNSLAAAQNDFAIRTATAIYILGRYVLLLFIPHPLSYDYSFNSVPLVSFSDARALISLLIFIALAFIAVKGIKKKNPVAFGIFFFAISIALVSNIIILIEATMAERFLYMPSLGFCIAIVFFTTKILKVNHSTVACAGVIDLVKKNYRMSLIFGVVLILFSIKTFSRNFVWKDNFTLLQHDIKTNPNSARILYSIGSTYIFEKGLSEVDSNKQKQDYRQGIGYLQKGLDILPEYGDAWFNMGLAYNYLEDYKNAAPSFDKGFEHTTKPSQQHYIGAGIAYGEMKEYPKSFSCFNRVFETNDTCYDASNNLGMFYSRIGKYDSSILLLTKAINLKPNLGKPYYNMGNTYAYKGDYITAIEWYNKAIANEPKLSVAYVNMGNSYGALKEYPKALEAFQKVLQFDPENEQARYNTGVTYMIMGDTTRARQFLPPKNN
ncbi:MAG: tetratricopeptide repeat protein [Chitinophagales bacterium]|nr:tetratricopeptide repeat protein [Chitinophagales bacterium]